VCMKKALCRDSLRDPMNTSIVVNFFFNARGALLERSPAGLYRSVLRQIFRRITNIQPDIIANFRERNDDTVPGWDWTEAELRQMLRTTLNGSPGKKYRFYIDALDECGETLARQVVDFLHEELRSARSAEYDLRICISSRHFPNLHIQSCRRIVMEDHNRADITSVISSRLRTNLEGDTVAALMLPELLEQIRDRSSGVFLWVDLVLQQLREASENREAPHTLSAVLHSIPIGLEALFGEMIRSIPQSDMDISTSLIFWILFAKRPLTLQEIRQGLAFQNCHSMEESFRPSTIFPTDDDRMKRLCRKWSRGLVEVKHVPQDKPPIVQFIHESVREFILNRGGMRLLQPQFTASIVGIGNDRLARSCFNYLRTEGLVEAGLHHHGGFLSSSRRSFLGYVCEHAFEHAECAERNGYPQRHIVENLSNFHGIIVPCGFMTHFRPDEDARLKLLDIACTRGLISVVACLLPRLRGVDRQHWQYEKTLFDATSRGDEDMVQLFLENGSEINLNALSRMMAISLKKDFYGILEAIMRCIPNETAPLVQDEIFPHGSSLRELRDFFRKSSPQKLKGFITTLPGIAPHSVSADRLSGTLFAASSVGYTTLVKMLLARGANLDFRVRYDLDSDVVQETTPLKEAITYGHSETLEMLLHEARECTLDYQYYENARIAAWHRNENIARILEADMWAKFTSHRGRLPSHQSCHARARLQVRALSGRWNEIYICLNLKVIDLKNEIYNQTGLCRSDQYLVFAGRLIREEEVLCDKRIYSGCRIEVLLPIWKNRSH
jgi:hypothetical protein